MVLNGRKNWNDRISSILIGPKTRVELYEHTWYKGRKLVLTKSTEKLSWFKMGKSNWNDEVSSIKIFGPARPKTPSPWKLLQSYNNKNSKNPGDMVVDKTGGYWVTGWKGMSKMGTCHAFASVEIHCHVTTMHTIIGAQVDGVHCLFFHIVCFDSVKMCLATFAKNAFEVLIKINGRFTCEDIWAKCR